MLGLDINFLERMPIISDTENNIQLLRGPDWVSKNVVNDFYNTCMFAKHVIISDYDGFVELPSLRQCRAILLKKANSCLKAIKLEQVLNIVALHCKELYLDDLSNNANIYAINASKISITNNNFCGKIYCSGDTNVLTSKISKTIINRFENTMSVENFIKYIIQTNIH